MYAGEFVYAISTRNACLRYRNNLCGLPLIGHLDNDGSRTQIAFMETLFTLNNTVRDDPDIDAWLASEPAALFAIARHWFAVMRRCGNDVREAIHDGCPTACVSNAAFAYVNVYSAHVGIGFFTGAMLHDPTGLLQGSGKRMRHIKLKPDEAFDSAALEVLIRSAYQDVRARVHARGASA